MKSKKSKILIILLSILLIGVLGLIIFYINDNKELDNDEISEKVNDESNVKVSDATPLLYEVSKDGSDNKLYLFGSIHLADDRAYEMNDIIMKAYNESDALAVEFDMIAYSYDIGAQFNDLKSLLITDGKTLEDYFSRDKYDILIQYMKDNDIYNSAYLTYRPVLIYSLITNAVANKTGLDSDKGIDMYFLRKAKKDKKEILEVESSSFQYEMLSSFSDQLFVFFINEMVENEKVYIDELNVMYDAWLKGNEDGLLSSDEISEDSINKVVDMHPNIINDINAYNDLLITKRNESMSEIADGYFNEGKNVFFVVGVGHIVGEDGIVSRLRSLGYNVNLVSYNT